MVQRGLDVGRVMVVTRRVGALFGAVVASSAGPTKTMRILTLKIARWIEGGDSYCSVYTRCSLRVC